jgi:hypothetical protein
MSQSFSTSRKGLLQKLVERVLLPPDDTPLSSLELFVGQIPPDVSFAPPLPPDCQLLGSHRHSPNVVEVLFDTPLTPTQLLHFYQEQLEGTGWYEQKNWYEQRERGFITTAYAGLGAVVHFCRGPQGPSLNIFALKVEGLTQVRVYLNTSQEDSPCKPPPEPDPRISSSWLALNLFPSLTPPYGGQHMEAERQSTRDSATTTALVETEHDISPLTLVAHYATQLEQAGWTRTGEGHSNQFAWQTWSLREEEKKKEWQGLFLFIKIPNSLNRFYVHGHIHTS